MADRVLNVQVNLKGAAKAQADLKKIEKGGTKIGNSFQWVQKNWAMATAIIAGSQGVINFLKGARDASLEHAQATEKLTAGLKNVAGYSDEARDSLLRQADAMERLVRVDADLITDGQAMLTSFQLNAEAVKLLTPRMLDMSAATTKAGQEASDLVSIATALGKAVTGGAGALTRYGVTLTDVQKEQLKTAEGMDRINLIADVLDANYKGMAEAVGQGAAGASREWALAVDQFKTSIGDFTVKSETANEIVIGFADNLRDLSDWISSGDTIASIDKYFSTFQDWLEKMYYEQEMLLTKNKTTHDLVIALWKEAYEGMGIALQGWEVVVANVWNNIEITISGAIRRAYNTVKDYMNAIKQELKIGVVNFLGHRVLAWGAFGGDPLYGQDIYNETGAYMPYSDSSSGAAGRGIYTSAHKTTIGSAFSYTGRPRATNRYNRLSSLGRAVQGVSSSVSSRSLYNRQIISSGLLQMLSGIQGGSNIGGQMVSQLGQYGGDYLSGAVSRTLGSKAAAGMFGSSIGSFAGPIGTIIGSLFGEVFGGLFKKKQRQVASEALIVKDINLSDKLTELLNVTKSNLNRRGAGGIDRLNNLRLAEGVAI